MKKIKYCPFCGSLAAVVPALWTMWKVECGNKKCKASGAMRKTIEAAKTAWNKRKQEEDKFYGY